MVTTIDMNSPDGPHRANRDALIGAIVEFCASEDLLTLADIRSALECEIDAAGIDALVMLKARLAADNGWA
jgi:hypothetical protein